MASILVRLSRYRSHFPPNFGETDTVFCTCLVVNIRLSYLQVLVLHKTTSGDGYITQGSIRLTILHWLNSSGRTMALGSTQSVTEMSIRDISCGGKTAGAYGWQSYHLHVRIFFLEILGTSTSWSPKGLSSPVKGYIYPVYYRHILAETTQQRVLIGFKDTALISEITIHNTETWSVVSAVQLWVVACDPVLRFPSTSRPSPSLNMRAFYSSPVGKSFTGRGSLPMSSYVRLLDRTFQRTLRIYFKARNLLFITTDTTRIFVYWDVILCILTMI